MREEIERVHKRLDRIENKRCGRKIKRNMNENSKPQEYDPYQYQSAQRFNRNPSSQRREFKAETTRSEKFEELYERLVMQANRAKDVQAPTQAKSSPEIDQTIEEEARDPTRDADQSDLSISTDSKPTVSNGNPKIEEIEVDSSKIAVDVTDMIADKSQVVKVEDWNLKIVEHVDFIGVDAFDVNPNRELANFFEKLQIIGLSRGIIFYEFQVPVNQSRYSKYLFSWHGRFEKFLVRSKSKLRKYSKYLFCWHGRNQASRGNSRTSSFQEEGNDVIRSNKFKAALNILIQAIWAEEQGTIKPIEGEIRGAQSGG